MSGKLNPFLGILFSVLALSTLVQSQTIPELGVHPEETYDGVRENVNLATGGLNVMIPLLKLPGRNGLDYSMKFTINTPYFTGACGSWSGCNGSGGASLTRSNQIGFGPTRPVYYQPDYNHKCMGVYYLWFGDGSIYTFPNLRTSCQYWTQVGGGGYWTADPNEDIRTDDDTRGEGFTLI
ncbi:MAG TPA: hypothetical protein VE377_10075 [Candidatus Dormibacteraeota bacterium]|nr:hypothetical protein [Candidatus Dormibacteraeota bacterium]